MNYTATFNKTYAYYDNTKGLYTMTNGIGFLICKSGYTNNNYKNAATHELGHAFGWLGHCRYNHSYCIMKEENSNVINLSEDEIRHLSQVY